MMQPAPGLDNTRCMEVERSARERNPAHTPRLPLTVPTGVPSCSDIDTRTAVAILAKEDTPASTKVEAIDMGWLCTEKKMGQAERIRAK